MKIPSELNATGQRTHWLDHPENVRKVWLGFLVVLALTVAAELVVTLHPHFTLEAVFGFHALYGFLACAAMIVGAKALAVVLKRPDTYYDGREEADDV